MDKNDTLILCCASVRRHLDAAQRKLGTDFPVRELSWENHKEPAVMHETLLRTMAELPDTITTVLSCVCSCGGVVLRTSLITGLPYEDEAAFDELCEFLRETHIERAGVFPYSPE